METTRGQDASVSFSTKEFVRSLSYRDLFTPFSLALLLVALGKGVSYLSFLPWVESYNPLIIATTVVMIALVNHVVYKIEHRRPNNFIGRCIQDIVLLLFLFLFATIRDSLSSGTFAIDDFSISGSLALIPGLAIVVTLFELVVAFLKRFLKLVKWQIL